MNIKKWLMVLLLWQVVGVVVTLIVSIPKGSFHHFFDQLLVCLIFTNLVAVMGSIVSFVYEKFLKSRCKNIIFKIGGSILTLTLIIAIAFKISLRSGTYICGLDSYEIDKWHLSLLIFNLSMITVISVSCVLYFLYLKLADNLATKIRENEKLQRLQVESKLAVLQSKVNPHFLFNTLNTMMDMVHDHPEKVEKMIFNLSDIYRKVLTLPDSALVLLKEELQLVREYLEIEKTRMGERLNFDFSIDESLLSFKIPPIILQILVENAIQHGISPKKEGGKINIKIQKKSENVSIEVADNGVGINRNYVNTGFGIYSVKQRLQLLYAGSATFAITLIPEGGTKVLMELPYEN